MNYRREVDGLRALAVIPVILFHAGFSQFSGGFIGVDIFFVISGYLITAIILSDLEAGTFSIARFYERRARRILPALFFVMAACIPFAWLWLLPSDLKDFSDSLIAVSVFGSNILFWLQSGYFDTSAELKPLLHTWSLAVEEQFYVLFPLFLMMTWRLGRKRIVALLTCVILLSLAAAHWGSHYRPSATFYLLHTRAWELGIGALIGFYYYKQHRTEFSQSISQLLSLTGLALILFSTFAYSEETPFPSLYTLVPVTGTALVLLFASTHTLVGRLLASKVLVGIGLISYSAYLWHQPLFSFARHKNMGEPSDIVAWALILMTSAMAYLSWRYIEKPFRNKESFSRTKIFSFAVAGSLTFIVLGLGLGNNVTNGLASGVALPLEITQSFARTTRASECFDKKDIDTRVDWLCTLGDESKQPSFLVFGDSHALSVLNAFDSSAKIEGLSGVFTGASGCPPLLGIYSLRDDQSEKNCYKLNQRIFNFVKKQKVKKVFFVSRWTYYTDGGYSSKNFSYLGLTAQDPKDAPTSRKAFRYGIETTVNQFRSIGVIVHLILQVPQQELTPKKIYRLAYKNGKLDEEQLKLLSVPLEKHKNLQSFVSQVFKENAQHLDLISFDDVFCSADRCLVGDTNGSYYFDDNHLSLYGEKMILEKTKGLLRAPN